MKIKIGITGFVLLLLLAITLGAAVVFWGGSKTPEGIVVVENGKVQTVVQPEASKLVYVSDILPLPRKKVDKVAPVLITSALPVPEKKPVAKEVKIPEHGFQVAMADNKDIGALECITPVPGGTVQLKIVASSKFIPEKVEPEPAPAADFSERYGTEEND